MSDSEYDSICEYMTPMKKNSKSMDLAHRSDSEEKEFFNEQTGQKQKTPTQKRSAEGSTKAPNNKKQKASTSKTSVKRNEEPSPWNESFDLFGLLTKEEVNTAGQKESSVVLPSVLTSRVANGSVIRRKHIDGEFYVEVKVYKTADAISVGREDRWQKALNSLKIQINANGDEWKKLQGFFKSVRKMLNDTESVFYAHKAN